MSREVVLLGYTKSSHTNWYPWNRFKKTFDELGKENRWVEVENFVRQPNKNYIFVCWNQPDVYDLIEKGLLTKEDIILQKVTSMTKRDSSITWGNNPHEFYKNWKWPAYQMCVDVLNMGYNLYAFGCRTSYNEYPIKKSLISKLDKRMIMIPWTSCMYSHPELQNQIPIGDGFTFDSAFIGSIWGVKGRGNLESVENYLMPILNESDEIFVAGMGTPKGPISNQEHIGVIKKSRLCPIISAPSWRAERGVQDRFWTVFASGRFGVVDTEGIYDFFDKNDVVCETDPEEYVEKSLFYLKNTDKQMPFIHRIQKRIKKEYNWNVTWKKILETVK